MRSYFRMNPNYQCYRDLLPMEFRVLHTTSMTEELARRLEALLNNLPGVQKFIIVVERQEFCIVFDESQLGFRTLVDEIGRAGCPLRNINAALLFSENSAHSSCRNI